MKTQEALLPTACILSLPAVIHLNSQPLFMCVTKRQKKLLWEKSFFPARDCGNPTLYCSLQATCMLCLAAVFEVSVTCCRNNLLKMSTGELWNACNTYQSNKGLSEEVILCMPELNNGLKYLCLVFFVACWVRGWKFFPGSVKSKWSWGSAVSCPTTGMSDRIPQVFPVLMQCMCIFLCSIDQCESIPVWCGSLGKFFTVAFV